MKKLVLIALILVGLVLIPITVYAHQSGCHRWHSCPSDTGSYVCGDLGYTSQCPSYYSPPKDPEPIDEEPTELPKSKIPDWVKNIFVWYGEGKIGENDLISALQFLIKEGIIKV